MANTPNATNRAADRLLKRKTMIVRVVNPLPTLEGYEQRANDYWNAARAQINRQIPSLGPVKHIFAEAIAGRGEDAMLAMQQLNPAMHRFAKSFADEGASVAQFEDADLLEEVADWSQCINAQPRTQKVREVIVNHYNAAALARSQHLATALDAGIGPGEVAVILAMSDNVPIPQDVERYIISPPELDQLDRWLRQQVELAQREMQAAAQAAAHGEPAPDQPASSAGSSGGLWTPP